MKMFSRNATAIEPSGTADQPIRLMVGTCPGSKQDAESMARSHIDRYFDLPTNSWIFLQEEDGVGFHFEIHEGGKGKPLLPSLLQRTWTSGEPVVVKPRGPRAVKLHRMADNTFQCLLLPESQSAIVEDATGVFPSNRAMIPYATTGQEWTKFGVMVFAIGLLVTTVSGAVYKSFDIAIKGYDEILEGLPTARLADLAGLTEDPTVLIVDRQSLPISQWEYMKSMPLGERDYISRLEYDGQAWNIVTETVIDESGFTDDTQDINPPSPGIPPIPQPPTGAEVSAPAMADPLAQVPTTSDIEDAS